MYLNSEHKFVGGNQDCQEQGQRQDSVGWRICSIVEYQWRLWGSFTHAPRAHIFTIHRFIPRSYFLLIFAFVIFF